MAWYWEAPPHAQKGMSSIRETGSSLCQRLIGALQRQLCGMFQGVSTKAVGLRALHMQKFYNLGPPLAFPLICLPESSKARMCSSTSDTSQMQHCIVGSQPCYQPSACFPPPPDRLSPPASSVLSCLLFIRFPGLKLGTSSSNVSIAHLPFSSHRRHHAHSSFISNMLDLAPQSPAPNSEPL